MSATKDLFAEFEVAQGSRNLFAKMRVYPHFNAPPKPLFSKFFVGSDGSQDLYAKFITQAVRDLKATFIVRQSASKDLYNKFRVYIFFTEGWADLKNVFEVYPAKDLPATTTIRHTATREIFTKSIIRQRATKDLPAEFIVRHTAIKDLTSEAIIRHSDSLELFAQFYAMPNVELKGTFIARHTTSEDLHCDLYVRHPYWLWTNRRYINGVIDAAETLIGDAKLEYVIEGVMEDLQGELEANRETYSEWTDITRVPVLIRRAATYGTVAALYARHSKTFRSRIIPTAAPVTITTIGDDERAMNYWEDKMQTALANYLSIQGSDKLWVSTSDEEPIFTMADIPSSQYGISEGEEWHTWLNQRST